MEKTEENVSNEKMIQYLTNVNKLIIGETSFSEKVRRLCTEIDILHNTYTTFTYVIKENVHQIVSSQFTNQINRGDLWITDNEKLLYQQFMLKKHTLQLSEIENLNLQRQSYQFASSQGCDACYFIPVFAVDKYPIGFFVIYYNSKKQEHTNILNFTQKFEQIVQLIFKMERYQNQIEQLTFMDSNTNLPSYNQFLKIVERYKLQKKSGVIKIVEPGEFSKIVELFGRPAGEALLKELGTRLKRLSASENSEIARFTSASLIMFTPVDFHSIEKKGRMLIMDSANEPFLIEGQRVYTTLKIGIAPFEQMNSCHDAIRFAESALTKSKLVPGTQTNYYIEQVNQDLEREILVLNYLKKAIQHKEITAHFQPKFELRRGRIASMEALARWISPELGFVSPGEFIPIAENAGLICDIELQIIEQVLKWQQQRQFEGKRIVPIAINISPDHFYHPLFIPKLKHLIQSYYADPHFLIIEITENMGLFDFEQAKEILINLRLLGIATSVDDFGIGYSSLSYLQKFSFSELKIDQSFSQRIDELATQTIVKSIIQIAHMLEMVVIAEGVETLEQATILKRLKCDVVQGFYFSKPLPIDEAAKLFDTLQIENRK